jgi:outer membrane protein OmpA-like peptidoglycan-associated protein
VHYRDIWFDSGTTDLRLTDKSTVTEMADYLKANPTLVIALDGHMDTFHKDFSNSRVESIRNSLIQAGVSADRIKVGAFGDAKLRREGHVEVLLMTGS